MEFFVPNVKEDMAEEFYQGVKKAAEVSADRPVSDRRIFRLTFTDRAHERMAEVGKQDEVMHETIVAIFDAGDLYLVCTTNRGVVGGLPILVGSNQVLSVNEFDVRGR